MFYGVSKNRLSHEHRSTGDSQEMLAAEMIDRGLNRPAKGFLARRGKGLRAAIIHHCYRIAGGSGSVPSKAVVAIELLHAGSLIVDDIEDDSELRRGEPTLHRQIGLPLALNTGNWMYFRALEILFQLDVSSDVRQKLLGNAISTVRECHEGQAIDLVAKIHEIQQCDVRATVQEISRRKTGALTALAARLAAILAGASEFHEESLAMFGGELGVCLQMVNDLDEIRSAGADGTRCDDLQNARVTWPWAWLAEKCSPEQFEELQSRGRDAQTDGAAARHVAATLYHSVGREADSEILGRFEQEFVRLRSVFDSTEAISDLHRALRVLAPSA